MRVNPAQPLVGALDVMVRILSRIGLSELFIRYAVVGTAGFCWDTGTVYALKGLLGLYLAKTCGFLLAASANWGLNRLWTFRHLVHTPPHQQWIRFLLTSTIGFVFNGGTFFVLISISMFFRNQPIFPNIAASFVGLVFNYFLSKRFVFS
jgi:putative flippase GtrA